MKGRILALLVLAVLALAAPAASAPAQTPKRGGTVVIGTRTASEPACLNVVLEDACKGLPIDPALVLPGAFEIQPDATFRPDLADAEVVASRPFTLVYHIRPEARWSDGVAVSAQDFLFTHQIVRKYQPDADESLHVRSMRLVDRKTVRVVLDRRRPDWRLSLFTMILPRHALAGEDVERVWRERIDNPKTGRAIGSGPFLVGPWDHGKQLTFVQNTRYWGPHAAHLDRIVVRFLPTEEIGEALRSGRIDMIDPFPALLQAQALELHRQHTPGIKVLSTLVNAWEHFDIRMGGEGGHAGLKNPLVRRALAYGINRAAIAREVGELTLARAAARRQQDSAVFLASSRYYQPNWRRYLYRPDRARRLLEQAGCSRGADGIFVCAGERLSLRFATAAGVERRELTVRLAQAQLRKVGIEVVPEFAPPPALGQILAGRRFDLALFAWIEGAITVGPWDVFGCEAGNNYTGYCDRLVTRDLLRATQILDDTRRAELLNGIDRRMARDVPVIPLYQVTGLWALNASIRGVMRNPAGSFDWNAEDWWLDD